MDDRLDADRIADLLLPLDGPYNPDAVVQAAATVAELVRRLNHATFHRSALRYPSQLYRVVGGLRAAVHGLGQTLRQLVTRLDSWTNDPRTGHDRGSDPATACISAANRLYEAALALAAVTRPLDVAHELTSHLKLDDTDPAPVHTFPRIETPNPPAQPVSTSPPAPPTTHHRRRLQ